MTASPAFTRALLSCGVLYAVSYLVANDLIAASLTPGYDRFDQAVSELSAIGAPAAPFLRAMLPVFTVLMLSFAAGVWRAGQHHRALRVTGALLLVSAAVGVSWLWFPMTSRQDMTAGGPMPANDVGHLVLSGLTVLLILLEMGFSAAAFGPPFRLFCVVCAVTMLGGGALMSRGVSEVSQGVPSPLMGLFERLMLGAWLVWLSGLSLMAQRRVSRSDNNARIASSRIGLVR